MITGTVHNSAAAASGWNSAATVMSVAVSGAEAQVSLRVPARLILCAGQNSQWQGCLICQTQ